MAQGTHATQPDLPLEEQRDAYNAAFDDLGLNWQWDAATFAGLPDHGRDGLREYLQAQHPHLLRAYDAEFLVEAIEAAKARHCATLAEHRHSSNPTAALDARARLH